MTIARRTKTPPSPKKLLQTVKESLEDDQAEAIVVIELDGKSSIADYMVIASGTSSRHVKALVDNVAEKAGKAGHKPIGVEGEEGGEWVLLDLRDTLVHVMLPKMREFYNLEKLWSLGSAADLAAKDA